MLLCALSKISFVTLEQLFIDVIGLYSLVCYIPNFFDIPDHHPQSWPLSSNQSDLAQERWYIMNTRLKTRQNSFDGFELSFKLCCSTMWPSAHVTPTSRPSYLSKFEMEFSKIRDLASGVSAFMVTFEPVNNRVLVDLIQDLWYQSSSTFEPSLLLHCRLP